MPSLTGNVQSGLQNRGLGTKVSVQLAKYGNAMELSADLLRQLDAGDVGFRGLITEWKGRSLGQLNPEMVNTKAMETRNKIIQLRDSLAHEIPEGGRETERTRQAVLASLPSTGFFESEANARTALKSARQLLVMRGKNYAAEVGRTPPMSMTPQEIQSDLDADVEHIKAKAKAGLMTNAQANDEIRKSYSEHTDWLKRYHP